jgi:hypothetical protein
MKSGLFIGDDLLHQVIVEFKLKDLYRGWDNSKFKVIFNSENSRLDIFSKLSLNLSSGLKKEIYCGILRILFQENNKVYNKSIFLDLPDFLNKVYFFSAIKSCSACHDDFKVVVFINEYTCLDTSKKRCLEIENKLSLIKWIHSHQVRGPISNILGIAEMLENWDTLSQEEMKTTIGYLKQSVQKLDENLKRFIRM